MFRDVSLKSPFGGLTDCVGDVTFCTMRMVKDTNVMVSALKSGAGASRKLLRILAQRTHLPLVGYKLWLEYRDTIARREIWDNSDTTKEQREQALIDFAALCEFVTVSRLWRPNLADENDNHIMELAICGNAAALVTFNKSDFRNPQFAPPGLEVLTPPEFLKQYHA